MATALYLPQLSHHVTAERTPEGDVQLVLTINDAEARKFTIRLSVGEGQFLHSELSTILRVMGLEPSPLEVVQHPCTCDIVALMRFGCRCGGK